MRLIKLAIIPLLGVTSFCFASDNAGTSPTGFKLSCVTSDDHLVDETETLKQFPHKATRIDKYTLEVRFAGGIKVFKDEQLPAEDDGLGRLYWRYCDFDNKTKTHLIEKNWADRFSGVIVFESNGKIINAGQTVLISPDKKKLLAIEQISGEDGKTWSLLDMAGKKLWSGYAGFTWKAKEGYSAVDGEFENPRWNTDLSLSADYICSGNDKVKKGIVILKKVSGRWKWLPEYQCHPH